MLNGAVTNRYTHGIFNYATEHGMVDNVDQSLQLLAGILQAHRDFTALLEHPLVTADAKVTAVKNVFGDTLEPSVFRLLYILFERGRSTYVAVVAKRFHELAEVAKGIATVEIESASSLTDTQISALENQLSSALNKRAHAVVHVNPQLIAGYRVKVGNRILDATVSGALAQFGEKLLASKAI